jgi:hypothetical protein
MCPKLGAARHGDSDGLWAHAICIIHDPESPPRVRRHATGASLDPLCITVSLCAREASDLMHLNARHGPLGPSFPFSYQLPAAVGFGLGGCQTRHIRQPAEVS